MQTGRPLSLHMPESVTVTFKKQIMLIYSIYCLLKIYGKIFFPYRAFQPDQHHVQSPF